MDCLFEGSPGSYLWVIPVHIHRPPQTFEGRVINGEWHGIFGNDNVFIISTENTMPCKLLWTGTIPTEHRQHYNNAIKWMTSVI
jgi:hypothetical protein